MPQEIMLRKTADNDYLHKDFHGALSVGLDYLKNLCGEDAVRDYLRTFTLSFYAPLREKIKTDGLQPLAEHYRHVYKVEKADFEITCNDDEMIIRTKASPAVEHMRKKGYQVSDMFIETILTVNKAMCEGTDFDFELVEYDEQTGRSIQRFHRRLS